VLAGYPRRACSEHLAGLLDSIVGDH